MGYLQQRHGMMMLGKTPDGTCPECAVAHDPRMPHNQQSLTYQYHFYDKNGRWPTWEDAMAHCTKTVQDFWKVALREKGILIKEERADDEK